MFRLKAPACIHFSLHVRLSWKWQIHCFFVFFQFFSFPVFFFFFFLLFCQNLVIFLQIWKIKMQNIAIRSIWLQPSLVPSQFSAPFLVIQIVRDDCDLNKSLKKKHTQTHTFCIHFWNPGELWDRPPFFFFF